MLRCPVCRADNTTGPVCRRCRADLSLLAAVEARRDFHFTRARAAVAAFDVAAARAEVELVRRLRPGPDAGRLEAIISLLSGDYSSALASCQAGKAARSQ